MLKKKTVQGQTVTTILMFLMNSNKDYVDEMTGDNTPPKPRYELPSCE